VSRPRAYQPLPLPARRAAWDALWDRLLQPPRREPAEPEHIPTPEELAGTDPHPRDPGRPRGE